MLKASLPTVENFISSVSVCCGLGIVARQKNALFEKNSNMPCQQFAERLADEVKLIVVGTTWPQRSTGQQFSEDARDR